MVRTRHTIVKRKCVQNIRRDVRKQGCSDSDTGISQTQCLHYSHSKRNAPIPYGRITRKLSAFLLMNRKHDLGLFPYL